MASWCPPGSSNPQAQGRTLRVESVNLFANSCTASRATAPCPSQQIFTLLDFSTQAGAPRRRTSRREVCDPHVEPIQGSPGLGRWLVENGAEAWERVRALVLLRPPLRMARRLGAAGVLERLYRPTWRFGTSHIQRSRMREWW